MPMFWRLSWGTVPFKYVISTGALECITKLNLVISLILFIKFFHKPAEVTNNQKRVGVTVCSERTRIKNKSKAYLISRRYWIKLFSECWFGANFMKHLSSHSSKYLVLSFPQKYLQITAKWVVPPSNQGTYESVLTISLLAVLSNVFHTSRCDVHSGGKQFIHGLTHILLTTKGCGLPRICHSG